MALPLQSYAAVLPTWAVSPQAAPPSGGGPHRTCSRLSTCTSVLRISSTALLPPMSVTSQRLFPGFEARYPCVSFSPMFTSLVSVTFWFATLINSLLLLEFSHLRSRGNNKGAMETNRENAHNTLRTLELPCNLRALLPVQKELQGRVRSRLSKSISRREKIESNTYRKEKAESPWAINPGGDWS